MSSAKQATAPLALEEDIGLEVPEEPDKEDDEDQQMPTNDSEGVSPTGSVMNFLTAVRIARWMARAYGYMAKKKKSYVSQDKQQTVTARQTSEDFLDAGGTTFRRSDESRRGSFFDATVMKDVRPQFLGSKESLELNGDIIQDTDTVCRWFASSYGETNKEYHEAYSREIIRQIKTQSTGIDSQGNNLKKPPAWF